MQLLSGVTTFIGA
ncbi:hypothetical protein D030_0214A, partial [Vibrio parahaemolyticus AQ3810]